VGEAIAGGGDLLEEPGGDREVEAPEIGRERLDLQAGRWRCERRSDPGRGRLGGRCARTRFSRLNHLEPPRSARQPGDDLEQ